MSRYLELLAIQRPFPIGADENQRVMFSVNFQATAAAPVEQWEEEIVKVLNDAGLATLGTDTFVGPEAVLPTGAGPYLTILDSGGLAPVDTHDGQEYERLSVQIIIRADKYRNARTRALAVWRALDGVRNTTVAA
jgi:hypothetical protein